MIIFIILKIIIYAFDPVGISSINFNSSKNPPCLITISTVIFLSFILLSPQISPVKSDELKVYEYNSSSNKVKTLKV